MALSQEEIQAARQKYGVPAQGFGVNPTGGTSTGPSAGGGGWFSGAQAQWQQSAPKAPQEPKLGQGAAGEFSGNALRAITAPLVRTGGLIEKGLDQTIGRVGNAIEGNGFTPTHTGEEAMQTADSIEDNADDTLAGKAGTVAGTVAPYLAGAGEVTAGEKAVGILPKVTAYVARKAPQLATDVGIGTAQTGDVKEGAIQGAGGLVGAEVLGKAGKILKPKTAEELGHKIVDIVAPKLSAKEAADALASRGGTKPGIFTAGKINTDPSVQRVADAVKEHVPGFNPKGSLVENINATKESVGKLAEDLKTRVIESGQDRIYPIKELGSSMSKAIEKDDVSIGLKGTQFEKQAEALKDTALKIARENGGKVSDLLASRKEFDALVDKIYPNLYDKEYTPMRNAVKSIRDAMTDFTEDHLPADVALRDSLTAQSRLLRAIENMSEKAAGGEGKEIGRTTLEKAGVAIKNHPVVSGFGGIAAYEAAKQIPGLGSILP